VEKAMIGGGKTTLKQTQGESNEDGEKEEENGSSDLNNQGKVVSREGRKQWNSKTPGRSDRRGGLHKVG
jgi:hypothetical protein